MIYTGGAAGEDGESTVLIDNSVYFSFAVTLEGYELTAQAVYNMACFAECVLFYDRVLLAPTTVWSPPADDPLFAPTGPCRAVPISGISEDDLRRLFHTAVVETAQDVSEGRVPSLDPTADPDRVRSILTLWNDEIADDPRAFAHEYSVPLKTDPASWPFMESLPTTQRVRSAEDGVAHHLLRTNVAITLSRGSTYHPQSTRTRLLLSKGFRNALDGSDHSDSLLRSAEAGARELRDALRTVWAKEWDGDAPLVLAVVLSGCRTANDVAGELLRLREEKTAKRYRRWVASLMARSRNSSSPLEVRKVAEEVAEARRVLTTEMRKQIGDRRPEAGAAARATGQVAPILSSVLNPLQAGLDIASRVAVAVVRGGLGDARRRLQVQHNLILVRTLISRHNRMVQLNDHLLRVLGKTLTAAQLHELAELRSAQESAMADYWAAWERLGVS